MVKVQFIFGATDHTLPAISFPHFEFYMRGNYSPPLSILSHWFAEVFFAFHGHKFELKDLASTALLMP